jgi:Tol biopolymer transport system component
MPTTHRSPHRALIVGVVVLVLSLPTINVVAAEDQPHIGFVSGITPVSPDPDPVDVYVANADGSGLVNLTEGYGAEWQWAWSPDGSSIAFISSHTGTAKLYVRSLDATEPFSVAEGPDHEQGLAWSPDSTRIAFVSSQDGDNDVYIADVVARTFRNVSNDLGDSSGPRWSPTGEYLAYNVRREDGDDVNVDVYIVGGSVGSPVNVTNDSGESSEGAWSPDGSRFLFVTDRDGNDEIYVADGNGRNPRRLTNSPANDRYPAWSPDGSRIAFSSGLEIRPEGSTGWRIVIPSRIYVMDADGSHRRAITDGSIDPDINPDYRADYSIAHAGPVWSPDGSRLAFAVTVSGPGPHSRTFTVYQVDPTRGGPAVDLWSGGGGWYLRWSPDGSRVAIQSTGNYGIDSETVIASANGTGTPVRLVIGVGSGPGGWSTYGTHFAYVNSGGTQPGDTVFVTAPDGTNPVDITAGLPGPVTSAASWRPQPIGPVGLVDPSSGKWYLRSRVGVVTAFYYGNPGDVPFMGDWDCDGVDTPGLFRASNAFVYLRNSNTQGIADLRFFFGNPGDVPLAGDFDGDGCDTVSIYRPSEQRFYIINHLGRDEGGLGAADFDFLFGNPGDTPVVGDWDGDGIDEVGLHRSSTGLFYWRDTLTTGSADGAILFGNSGDRFVTGDWGKVTGADSPAVFRPGTATFYFRHTLTEGIADSQFTWPGSARRWLPVAGVFGLDRR